ncbi:contact site A protein [Tieghemostelium lacteum]|uniref:Contact site A protein n=1 Tax=Tieghemostelium lacteum TaxID=361077 RepID=A0A151ZEU1_TIELA|nr:contact site A protein [Tieghemostelium lacteum]|eukprot:KYQ92437.1 contact site A protein [Tieghemostelium lacteum]
MVSFEYIFILLFIFCTQTINGQYTTKAFNGNLGGCLAYDSDYFYSNSYNGAQNFMIKFNIADYFNSSVVSLNPVGSLALPSQSSEFPQLMYTKPNATGTNYLFTFSRYSLLKILGTTSYTTNLLNYFAPTMSPFFAVLSNFNIISITSGGGSDFLIALMDFSTSSTFFISQMQLNPTYGPPTSNVMINENNKTGYFSVAGGIVKLLYSSTNGLYSLELLTTAANTTTSTAIMTNDNIYYCSSTATDVTLRAFKISSQNASQYLLNAPVTGGIPYYEYSIVTNSLPITAYDSQLDIVLYLMPSNINGNISYSLWVINDVAGTRIFSKYVIENLPAPLSTQAITLFTGMAQLTIFRDGPTKQYASYMAVGNKMVIIPYESFCANDCNGKGFCSNLTCSCFVPSYGTGCQYENPTITSVNQIIYKSSNNITISGTNFYVPTVTIGTSACTISSFSLTEIICTVGQDFAYSTNYYTLKVTVNNGAKSVLFSSSYSFLMPTITDYSQNGLVVYILGQNFYNTSYTIASTPAITASWESSNKLLLNVPKDFQSGAITLFCAICPTLPPLSLNLDLILESVEPTTILYVPTPVTFSIWFYNAGENVTINQGPTKTFSVAPDQNKMFHMNSALDSVTVPSNRYFFATSNQVFSNQIQYNYSTPIIDSANQKNRTTVEVVTSFMGIDATNLQVYFNEDQDLNATPILGDVEGIKSGWYVPIPLGSLSGIITFAIQNYIFDKNLALAPVIDTVEPMPSIGESGIITISGVYIPNNFYLNGTWSNTLYLDCAKLKTNSKYKCEVPPGTGYFTVGVTMDSLSDTYEYQFQNPVITSIEPNITKLSTASNVTITGDQFADVDLVVSIGGRNCENITVVDITRIECQWVSPSSKPANTLLEVLVSVDSLIGKSNLVQLHLDCPKGSNDQQCSGQGQCQITTGVCECKSGFKGDSCGEEDKDSSESLSSSPITSQPTLSLITLFLFAIFLFNTL